MISQGKPLAFHLSTVRALDATALNLNVKKCIPNIQKNDGATSPQGLAPFRGAIIQQLEDKV